MTLKTLFFVLAGVGAGTATVGAQVPQLLSYQGRVTVGGVNFDGTGQFKFALVDAAGTTAYWTNDGTHLDGSEPGTAVTLTVAQGLYSVLLGDASIPGMTAIPAGVFSHSDVRLRVWFNDGVHGSQLLSPDQRIAAVGYAIVAGTVPDGAITGTKIAAGAVGGVQLGLGKITGYVNCNLTDPAHTFVYLRGTSSLVYVGDVTPNGYPFQLTLVEPGTYTVVVHSPTGFETSAQVTVAPGATVSDVILTGTDLASDVNNCGSCGTACAPPNATGACHSGTCGIGACNAGYADCDQVATNGCEVDLLTDRNNCGACGMACPAGGTSGTYACVAGSCQIQCASGYTNCAGTCVSLVSDPNNCGKCGDACPGPTTTASYACVSGMCQVQCISGYTNCAGACVNVASDPNNCGSCGRACPTVANGSAACSNGACATVCNAGYTNCGGVCTDLQSDANNCGSCGTACAAGHSCVNGMCSS